MSINYVIATFNGFTKRCHKYPTPGDILKNHIQKLKEIRHSLTRITIMKASSPNPVFNDYYNIDFSGLNTPVEYVDVENYGYSMGQWLKAFERDKGYDFYIFTEDDYCPNIDNFDLILKNIYSEKFPDKIGFLCSMVMGGPGQHYPAHFSGTNILSKETLNKLYSFPRWQGEPRKFLDLLDSNDWPCFNDIRSSYRGGYYQLVFSHLFTLSGIKLEGYLDYKNHNGEYYVFPYWDDQNNEIGGEAYIFDFYSQRKREFTWHDLNKSLIVPIQLSNKNFIIMNTHLR